MRVVPVTFRQACAFVSKLHRHNKPPRGHKFSIGLIDDGGQLVGVAMVGRPVARHFDDGFTVEVNRTCTDGTRNANSMLYGAAWKASKAMGYTRAITYTQEDETGSSLRAAGWLKVKNLEPRASWAGSTKDPRLLDMRTDLFGDGSKGDTPRMLWEITSCFHEGTSKRCNHAYHPVQETGDYFCLHCGAPHKDNKHSHQAPHDWRMVEA